jgi:hypothetical protein
LSEERPVPIAEGHVRVGASPDLAGGYDIEDGEAAEPVGVVESHPVADATSSVVSGDREPLVTEQRHGLQEVVGEGAFGVRCVVGRGRGSEGGPVSGEVGRDDGEPLTEQVGGGVPHEMRLRIAVQQQDRGAAAPDAGKYGPPLGRQMVLGEALEHVRSR